MKKVRKVKFEYYELISRKKQDNNSDRDRPFDLLRWIEKVESKSLDERTHDYYDERVRLEKIEFDDMKDLWFLNFTRLRSTNIPLLCKIDEESEPIELNDDEFIGEDVSLLYDKSLSIIMLQRNIHSLSPSGIQYYINLVWENEDEEIYLRPITLLDPMEKIKKGNYYRKITIRFSDLPNKTLHEDTGKGLKHFVESFGEAGAVNAQIVISVGRAKNNTLEKETVKDIINDIYLNKDIITKAELAKKNTEDSRVELIDLFEHKLHDYINFVIEERQSLGAEVVWERMSERYNEKKGEIISQLGSV